MKNLILIHRWLGVIACLAIFMFAGSGILHPVMSWLQPKPVQFMAPRVEMPAAALSLRTALEKNHIDRFSSAALIQLPQSAAYRVQSVEGAHYLRVDDGALIENGERVHAEFLARHFLGDSSSKVISISEQRSFDDDYVFVNRLLPVWRVDFSRDDGMRLYVDTAGNRLATLTDTKKRVFQTCFRTLHDFDFLENHKSLRLVVMLSLLFATFSTAVAGVAMYVRLRRAGQRLKKLAVRRWHRRLSLAVAIVAFSFTISGAWHLLQSQREIELPPTPQAEFLTQELGDTVLPQSFVLLRVNNQVCYRQPVPMKQSSGHEHHHANGMSQISPAPMCLHTHSLQPIADADVQLAEQLARHYSQDSSSQDNSSHDDSSYDNSSHDNSSHNSSPHKNNPIKSAELITKFGGEYGFINKRLPVWKVQFKNDSTRWYVETATGVLALRADDADAREGWVFSIFHKARFIDDAYKNLRDIFLMLSAALMMIVSLLGVWLFLLRLNRSRGPLNT